MIKDTFTPLKRFRQLLKVDQKDITQVYVYALFNGLVNLSLPVGIQAIINLIQGGEVSAAWIVLVSFVIGGIALTGILQLLQLRIVENIAQKIFSRASFEFAYRIPRIKSDALYNYFAPELANRFFDTLTIQKGLPKILIDFSLALFQIVVGLVLLSLYHPFFILFSFMLIGLIYIIMAITGPRGLRSSLKESKFKYQIAFWLEEIARTRFSFKLVTNSTLELSESNDRVNQYLEAREKHFGVLVTQFLYLIGFKVLIAAGLLISGSILVFNEQMNIGQFVAAEIIIILIIASVEKLIKSLDSIYDVLTALEKIGYVTDMPLDETEGLILDNDGESLAIAAENLCYKYPDSNEYILKNINFNLPQKSSVYITGASGSGKSTLMQLLSGVMQPSAGLIQVNGIPMKSLDQNHLKSQMGFCLCTNEIFQGTVLQNIRMGRAGIGGQDISEVLRITQLSDYISSLPLGLQTVLAPEGSKIPRSVQNKIILARALANQPKLLLLEDPLDHIPAAQKEDIIKALTSQDVPWTIIVTSVDPIWEKYIPNTLIIEKS